MALPSGDDQTIIWRLVVEMQNAVRDIESFKGEVGSLKQLIKNTATETGSSFKVIAETIENQLKGAVDKAKRELSDLQSRIKELKQLTKSTPTSDIEKTTKATNLAELTDKQSQVDVVKQKLVEAQSLLSTFRQQSTLALTELNREARNAASGVSTIGTSAQQAGSLAAGSFGSAVETTAQYQQRIETLRVAIEQTKQKILEIQGDLERLRATGIGGEFTVDVKEDELQQLEQSLVTLESEYAKLGQIGTESFKEVSSATQQASTTTASYFQQLNSLSFDEKVAALKARLVELQQVSGLSFKQIAAGMKLAFKEEATNSIEEFKAQLRSAKAELKSLQSQIASPSVGTNADQLSQMRNRVVELTAKIPQLNTGIQQMKQNLQSSNVALSQATQQLNATGKGINILGMQINNLGDIAKLVFMGLFGGGILSVLYRFVALIGESVQKALDFSKAVFQLEVGVRALRRVGIDVTFDEVLGNLDKINEGLGNLFSNLELIEGAASFTNLIRDLGLTKDQIFELQNSVATLAVVNGRSMEDVQRTVALALSSGYTEGLQRLGVSINRLTIAEEANSIGFKGGYVALTEQQRAIATYNILVRKTAVYVDDMAKAQDQLFGSIQKTNAEIENQKAIAGQNFLFIKDVALKAWAAILKFANAFNPVFLIIREFVAIRGVITAVLNEISTKLVLPPAVNQSLKNLLGTITAIRAKFDDMADGVKNFVSELEKSNPVFAAWIQGAKQIMNLENTPDLAFGGQVDLGEPVANLQLDKLMGMLEEQFGEIKDLEKETAEKRIKLNEDLQDDLRKIERDGAEDRAKILQDYSRDIEDLERDFTRRVAEISRNLSEKLKNIDIKLSFNINEANLKFNFDVEEVQRKFLEDVAKAQEEYRQKEIERERKFQEELLRLREDYLMELEDALENRDARAVLRARRQYNLDRERARRENELAKVSAKEGLDAELRDLRLRRDARLRELKFELEQRIAELQRNAQFERDEAARQAAQDLADLQRKLADEKAERDRAFQQKLQDQRVQEAMEKARRWLKFVDELADINAFEQAKLKEIGVFLAQQSELMGLSAEEVRKVAEAYFGDSGYILTIMREFAESIKAIIASLPRGMPRTNFGKPSKFENNSIPKIPSFATGGAGIATKPTIAQFGEVPEVFMFAPLDQLDKLSGLFKNVSKEDGSGNVKIGISLSPGLEAQIIEQSMEKIANVMFEVQRQ